MAHDDAGRRIRALDPQRDRAAVDSLLARLRLLANEREELAAQMKRASPRAAALRYPRPLTLEGVRETLDTGSILLSYSVASDRTLLFVVEPADSDVGLSVYAIPLGATELKDRIREFHGLIANRIVPGRAILFERARALYDLLVRPAEGRIAKSKRVLIAPDGPLNALPFAALLRSADQYLIEWKPLHSVLSATVYAELKKMRHSWNDGDRMELIAFGDPYHQRDPKGASPAARAARRNGLVFGRLPFSRDEVLRIASVFDGRTQVYLRRDASEERVKSLGSNVRRVHFATHAFLDETIPLDSALVLSIPGDTANAQENGLLEAWEIFEKVRLDADLVVLSACQTALGSEFSGEGLIGLTRAFQYAGAHSVLATLWNIDDRGTAEFMARFYRHLQRGMSKDEALRTTQQESIRSKNSNPFYWAAFSLNGDWQ